MEDQQRKVSLGLGSKLADSTRRWILDKSPRTHLSYSAMLHRTLGKRLVEHLNGDFASELRARGLVPLSKERAAITVKRVLLNTQDLHRRLLTAPNSSGVGLVSDGRYSLETLVDDDHQDLVADSLTQAAQDDYEKQSFADSIPDDAQSDNFDPDNPPAGFVGLTGRKMWNTVDSKDSRHMDLDGQVVSSDETFTMPDGEEFSYPREDPTDVAQSSNCSCYLSYESIDEDGELNWQ